ncbi:MAG: hypothetical protein OEV87_12080 [Phycisphaerae bacterium]|nr:hypothetical protein [Phycisphaerae bacterium]
MTENKDNECNPNQMFWIVAKSSHCGAAGTYIAGQTYQVNSGNIKAVNKEIDSYRKSLPKKQRSAVKNFQFKETVAPWDAHKDMDRVRLSEAQDLLNSTQAELNQLRITQQALINKKATLVHDLAEFEKASDEDLKKPGMLNRLHRKTKANLEIVEADIEQTVDDIKEYAAAAKSLEKEITDLRDVIAAKESKGEPASEDTESNGTQDQKTMSQQNAGADNAAESSEPAKDDANPQGQTA